MSVEMFDEHDLVLLHALQIAPRVSWAEAARILDSTPATLAGRWERLRSQGLAWVTAHARGAVAGPLVIALVEVDCAPGARDQVVRSLCQDPRAVTVEESARGRDLLLTVITSDLSSLTRFVLDDLPRVPGVQRQRAYLATAVHYEGSSWRLDALNRVQRTAFEAVDRTRHPAGPPPSPPASSWPLVEALCLDGRRSAADLARVTGRNPATVRRQLARLLASDLLSFRCEVAQETSRRPISCTWMCRVPAHERERTVAALSTLPELRLCLSTTGDTNLTVTVWARSLHDLLRIERLLGERLPSLTLVDSAVTLRTPKRMGWLLDADGRSTGEVVVPSALGPR